MPTSTSDEAFMVLLEELQRVLLLPHAPVPERLLPVAIVMLHSADGMLHAAEGMGHATFRMRRFWVVALQLVIVAMQSACGMSRLADAGCLPPAAEVDAVRGAMKARRRLPLIRSALRSFAEPELAA